MSAELPSGVRASDHISLGVIARAVPLEAVRQVPAQSGHSIERERDLPTHVMVCYAIALALYMGSNMRVLLDGVRRLWGTAAVRDRCGQPENGSGGRI